MKTSQRQHVAYNETPAFPYHTYNSYRPDGPTSRLDANLRRGDTWTPGPSPASHAQINSRTVRHDTPNHTQSIEPNGSGRPKAPQVYDRGIDRLIVRTVRAYRLVISYQWDCPTGHRWMPEHIDLIHEAGKMIETDRSALESLRLGLVRGDDAAVAGQIHDAAHALRDYCEEIQELVRMHERAPVFNGKDLEWGGQGRSVEVPFRDAFGEKGDVEGIQRVAGRGRHEPPVKQRDPSPRTQPERYDGSGRRGYFASDTWRPTEA
ncbi:hypothetical protein PMIN02_011814 [Paraphaeosphaeria minitans]